MKNMFWVINKEKLYAYVVSVLTIVILFFMSHILKNDTSDTEEVSSNIYKENIVQNNVLNSNSTNNKLESNIVPN